MHDDFEDWCGNVEIENTLGVGWCVRIDGSDIFDHVNTYKVKTRRTLQIASGLKSEEAAKAEAVRWLNNQLARLV